MQRRNFVRLAGGGTLGAALPLGGCTSAMPPAALAAWDGPSSETDIRRWALAHAILAPNPHNLQSWLVDLREPGVVTLWVDAERLLPRTDPLGRQVTIGQGAFVEVLAIALAERGLLADVQAFPDGEPGPLCHDLPSRPVARITVRQGARPDPLFAQIRRRHTAKSDYDITRPVRPWQVARLGDTQRPASVHFGAALDDERVSAMRTLCWESARTELLTPRTVMESVQLTRVGPSEIAQHRDGISINSPMLRLASALGMFDRSSVPAEGSTAYKQMMARFEGHSRTAMGFVWLATDRGRRVDAFDAGRAYLRMQLRATEMGLGMHPMSQALQEFPEMAAHYERAHRLTLGRPAPAGAGDPVLQMFCRVGTPVSAAGPTPRRELDAIAGAKAVARIGRA